MLHLACAPSSAPAGGSKLIGVANPDQHRRLLRSKIAAVLALLAALLVLALALARDADAYIYWTNFITGTNITTDTIGRANLDGTGVNQSFISGASSPIGIAVDADHIYWANFATGTIGRANLDGTGVNQSFITGASGPRGVAVDASYVYWTNLDHRTRSAAPTSTAPASTRASSPAPARPAASRSTPATSTGRTQARDTIGRANLDGTGVNQSFISGASVPDGVAVDAGHIYWTNSHPGHDRPRQPRRHRRQPELHQRPPLPQSASRSTPATSTGRTAVSATIGRANLDGTGVNQSFISGGRPIGVAVDALPLPTLPTTVGQCSNGGWKQFGFKSQGRCVAFVVLTRICDALERHGIHLKVCPPTPPNPLRPN